MHKFCRGAAALLGAMFALSLVGCERRQPTPDVSVTVTPPPATTTPTTTPPPAADLPASPAWPASPASQ
ncbi:hypothetical protein [Pelomonas sp. Root1444]|uniref:hypothetical protein n=1 Tax=Pelomonas sp. Root1444 TaxID=1736464 RepID=UPI00070384A3|nr:hypothetical protein [Pelomonas sp. Root1444]KQY88886.1 hypothetical protein ASD35_15280 [Pelomonas sp. Root1444]